MHPSFEMTTSKPSTVSDNSIGLLHIQQPAASPIPTTSSDVSAPVNTKNDFAPSNAPNLDATSEVELALRCNETAVESLSQTKPPVLTKSLPESDLSE